MVLAAAVAVSGQSATGADYFNGGLNHYKNDYTLTGTANVFNGGTVLITNSITNDGQVLNIYDNAKTISKNAVNVQNGGAVNIQDGGKLDTKSLNVGATTSNTVNSVIVSKRGKINASDKITIGQAEKSHGLLNVSNQDTETVAKNIVIGEATGSSGQIVLHDQATLKTQKTNEASKEEGSLTIGDKGKGELTVDNATVDVAGNTLIAKEKGSKGELTLTNNAKFKTKDLNVGTFGEATLKVTNSQLDTEAIISGFGEGSKVNITLDKATVNTGLLTLGSSGQAKLTADKQSTLNVSGDLSLSGAIDPKQEQNFIGDELVVQNGSNVTVKNTLGIGNTGRGRVEVVGENSVLNANNIQVGGWLPNIEIFYSPQQYGNGTLEVKNKANVAVENDVVIGNIGKGQVTVDGAKVKVKRNTIIAETQASMGTLNIKNGVYETDDLAIGKAGTGKLNTNNSQINTKTFRLGFGQEATADAMIDNSTINATGTIILGHYGKAKLTATNASTIVGENLYLFSGVSPIQKRDSVSDELIVNKGSNINIENVLGIGNTGGAKVVVSGERSAINVGGEIQIGGWLPNNVDITGESQHFGNGVLEVKDGAVVTAPTIVVGNQGSGKLVLENGATIKVGNIERKKTAKGSVVSIANSTIQLTQDQNKLFNGFTDNDKIELKAKAIFDTQNHDVAIFDGARLTGWGSLIKQGSGTLTLDAASKGYTGQTHINEGTLKLFGDYEFAKDEILAIAVQKDKYGKLESIGKLDVTKGTIKIKAFDIVDDLVSDTNKNADTVWKDIVKAEKLVGQFKEFSVVGKEDKPIRNGTDLLHLHYHGNAIDLKVGSKPEQKQPEQKQPTSVFTKAVQKYNNISALSLAQALDKTIESPNEQNKKLALALSLGLDGLSQAQISQAASQLQPLLEGATNRVIADSSAYAVQAINAQPLTSTHQVWASAIGNDGKHKASTTGLSAYNDTHVGAVVGVQGAVGETNFGVAVSHLQGDIDSKGATNHQVETKTTQALLYAKHQAAQGTELYGHVGVGRSDVDGKRHISLLAKTTATAQYQAKIAQAGLGVSHQIGSSQRNLTPFVGIDYTKVSSDAYQEKGAGVYNLAVNKNTYESLTSTLGVKANYTIGKLNLNATLASGFENGDKRSQAQASFASTNVGFSTTGHEVGKHFGVAGVGVGYQLTPKAKLSLGYQGQWRKNYDSQSGTLALTMQF